MDVTVRLLGSIKGEVEIKLQLLMTENDLEEQDIDLNIIDFAECKYT